MDVEIWSPDAGQWTGGGFEIVDAFTSPDRRGQWQQACDALDAVGCVAPSLYVRGLIARELGRTLPATLATTPDFVAFGCPDDFGDIEECLVLSATPEALARVREQGLLD
jgi:hypothetical protein